MVSTQWCRVVKLKVREASLVVLDLVLISQTGIIPSCRPHFFSNEKSPFKMLCRPRLALIPIWETNPFEHYLTAFSHLQILCSYFTCRCNQVKHVPKKCIFLNFVMKTDCTECFICKCSASHATLVFEVHAFRYYRIKLFKAKE